MGVLLVCLGGLCSISSAASTFCECGSFFCALHKLTLRYTLCFNRPLNVRSQWKLLPLFSPWSLLRSPALRGSLRLGGGECRLPALRLRRPRSRWPLGCSISRGTHFCLDPTRRGTFKKKKKQQQKTRTPFCPLFATWQYVSFEESVLTLTLRCLS